MMTSHIAFDEEALVLEAKRLLKSFPDDATCFDIFGTADLEDPLCQVLQFFLDPSADHGMGGAFARAMIEAAGGAITDEELTRLRVLSEVQCNDIQATPSPIDERYRSIDLVLMSDRHYVAIEVKNRSGQSGEQLRHYSAFVDRKPQAYKLKVLLLPEWTREQAEAGFVRVTFDDLHRALLA